MNGVFTQVIKPCAAVTVLAAALAGCDDQARGFALPPGNATTGQETFVALQCNHCHSVADGTEKAADGHPEINFSLGGPTTRVRTYGDLVTSIINPSHKVSGYPKADANVNEFGESNMRVYNDIMTVQQLVDLTTYLQGTYKLVQPQYQPYYYGP